MFENFLKKFVKWLDPKLEKYRPIKPPKITPKYTPRSIEDFIGILQRTPKNILSSRDRNRIAAIMSFDDRTVGELMIPRSQMIFVGSNEVLGPLILDKLYKSGFTNFPVIDPNNRVKGIIHTEALNALEIKKTDRAEKYINEDVYYLHSNDSLQFAVEEIERTNSYYFLILDEREAIVGFFTIQILLDYLLN
jgi:CBS domain containing-hemolysin-like protein